MFFSATKTEFVPEGVWYATTHHPDRIIAAAAISGYMSIQSYVPFQMWHECDPRRKAVCKFSKLKSHLNFMGLQSASIFDAQ